jgi:hypothetical protein
MSSGFFFGAGFDFGKQALRGSTGQLIDAIITGVE